MGLRALPTCALSFLHLYFPLHCVSPRERALGRSGGKKMVQEIFTGYWKPVYPFCPDFVSPPPALSWSFSTLFSSLVSSFFPFYFSSSSLPSFLPLFCSSSSSFKLQPPQSFLAHHRCACRVSCPSCASLSV